MNEPFDFDRMIEDRIVYVREADMNDLPDEVRKTAPKDAPLYAIHGIDGERLALVADRKLAFRLARENEFAPVSVH